MARRMNPAGGSGRRWIRPVARCAVAGLLVLAATLGQRPAVAAAHPLDEYRQALYLTLGADGVAVELDLSPGVFVASQVVAQIDADGDGQISQAEGQAYGRAVVSAVRLELDQQIYPLTLTAVDVPPMLALTAGLGTIRLEARPADGGGRGRLGAGPHQAFVYNGYGPSVKSAYQATAALQRAGELDVTQQRRDELQRGLRVDYALASAALRSAAAPAASPLPFGGAAAGQRWVLESLSRPALSPWLLLTALALSALLGGLHALTPGHGKSIVGAYLVGSRGTAGHALFLGGAVTLTHTTSVIAAGLLALLASHYFVPNLLVPALQVGSGVLVVLLGARLIRTRWRSLRHGHDLDLDHGHDHDHGHTHGQGLADHGHDHGHDHPELPVAGVTWRDLAAMGVSGGLTPCPEAIGILLVAIGLNRIGLGLGLLVAFSLGLAAVLSLIGLLLVRARGLADRFGGMGQRNRQLLPLASAVVVTVLGAAICAQGALGAGILPPLDLSGVLAAAAPVVHQTGSLALLGTALTLGLRHGIDRDHLAAITGTTRLPATSNATGATHPPAAPPGGIGAVAAPVAVRPALVLGGASWQAVGLASLYAGGHALVVLLLGVAALKFGAVLPEWIDPLMERVVGATLVLLGAWVAYSLVRYWRGDADFRPRSRWMLVFPGLRRLRAAAEARLFGHSHVAQRAHGQQLDQYGPGTAFGTGLIHGIGAETGTQVLVIAAVGGAASQGLGVVMLLAFVVGLLLSNTATAVLASAGFMSSTRVRPFYIGVGVLAAAFSLWVGGYALFGSADRLPDLQAPLTALFGKAAV